MVKTAQDIILKPIITEASMEDLRSGKYTFMVAKTANKTEVKDAVEETDGVAEAYTHIVAVAKNDKGEVTAAKTDALQAKMTFNAAGASTLAATEAQTKRDIGENYGMAAYGKKHDGSEGQPKEWFEQADAFDAALVGLTADKFATLMDADGYGTGDLATAGCTIGLDEMVETAVKAAK